MSLFVCSKCGCIDNTATSYYWALIRPCKNRIYDKSLKGYEGKPLCSECAAIEYSKGGEVVVVPGTWHGKFKKEWPTEEEKKHIGKKRNRDMRCHLGAGRQEASLSAHQYTIRNRVLWIETPLYTISTCGIRYSP